MAEKIPVKFLDIEGDGFHLQARIKINGKVALVIVDTGASRTVFDTHRIERFLKKEEIASHDKVSTGLGTSSMHSKQVVLGRLDIGKIKLENFHAVLLDLKHVNQTYETIGLAPIDGVLGSDILHSMKAVIDFGKKNITLFPGRKPSVKSGKTKKVTKRNR